LLPGGAAQALLELMAGPELCDRSWIWRQLDHEVGAETLVGPGQDAAVLGVRGTSIQLAFVMSGDGRLVGQDPRLGVQHLLASALRRLACVGARPIGITDGLNHGDPRRPEVMWELREVIGGLGEAAAALEVPVVSGNVSLYNETDGRAVRPTPILGVVGRSEGPFRPLLPVFLPGLEVALLGDVGEGWLGASLFAAAALGEHRGRPAPLDLPFERELAERVCQLLEQGLLLLAHDVGEGGLGCALAELCMGGTGGCFDLPGEGPLAARLFGEDAGRVLVAYAPEHREAVGGLVLGQTGGPRLQIGPVVLDVEELRRAWASTLPALLEAGDGG
jgi:phosphoribosylformylglycinamidine synthase